MADDFEGDEVALHRGRTFAARGTWRADELGVLNVSGVDGGLAQLRLRPNAARDGYDMDSDGLKQTFVRAEPKP